MTDLTDRYLEVRALTEDLAAPLTAEDQTVQSMADASPTKWHRAHTTWFFEEFVLAAFDATYQPFDSTFRYQFNSYYDAVGPRHPRPARGVISRPGVAEIANYRSHVDAAMATLLERTDHPTGLVDLVELGLHHEQQHQELVLMDIKHAFAQNSANPIYRDGAPRPIARCASPPSWVEIGGGLRSIGWGEVGFCFDNEQPRHDVWIEPFELGSRPVEVGQVLEFIADGGYRRSELWLSDGWATVQAERWESPLYWQRDGDGWTTFTLAGRRPVDPSEPACHLSYYEADAIARWSGARLPTEAEWEVASTSVATTGNLLDLEVLHPRPAAGGPGLVQVFGDVWEWTASAYLPYPGFRPAPGAVGEYNGKFMVNQHVLRGGSCATPADHIRPTYRNFFPPSARWAFSGARMVRDLEA